MYEVLILKAQPFCSIVKNIDEDDRTGPNFHSHVIKQSGNEL
jgi:hypothetical protein